jgi:hypothetical protein
MWMNQNRTATIPRSTTKTRRSLAWKFNFPVSIRRDLSMIGNWVAIFIPVPFSDPEPEPARKLLYEKATDEGKADDAWNNTHPESDIRGMSPEYLIFRLEKGKQGSLDRKYLTYDMAWSKKVSKAHKAGLGAMRQIVKRIKSTYPDLIIERYVTGLE